VSLEPAWKHRTADGRVEERDHSGLPAAARKQATALIAGVYLAGPTRAGCAGRSRLCSAAPWEGHGQPSLAQGEGRLGCLERALLEGRADHPAHSRWHGGAGTARQEGHVDFASRGAGRPAGRPEVLLAVKNMGGESEAAWRALLDDLVNRGLKTPELVIVDGAPGSRERSCPRSGGHAGPALHGA